MSVFLEVECMVGHGDGGLPVAQDSVERWSSSLGQVGGGVRVDCLSGHPASGGG